MFNPNKDLWADEPSVCRGASQLRNTGHVRDGADALRALPPDKAALAAQILNRVWGQHSFIVELSQPDRAPPLIDNALTLDKKSRPISLL